MKKSDLLIAVTFATGLLFIFQANQLQMSQNVTRDTIEITKTDTLTEYITITESYPKERKVYITRHDTIEAQGKKVDIPIETKVYSDTLPDSTVYKASITGYRASLDSIWIKYPKTTINTVTEREVTVTKYIKKHWGYGPSVTLGYDPFERRISTVVGISVHYNF